MDVFCDLTRACTYDRDWMHKYKGNSRLLLRPRTTHQVSGIMAYCNERSLAIVPQVIKLTDVLIYQYICL
jgi:FAD/FMN-containing dehydrogenase